MHRRFTCSAQNTAPLAREVYPHLRRWRLTPRFPVTAPSPDARNVRVFDTVADSRNEPAFNPAMTGVELLTPPPVGLGTRFRARMGKAGTDRGSSWAFQKTINE